MKEIIGDREAYLKAQKEEMKKPESEREEILWNEFLGDEVPARPKHPRVKEILCYLKFGKCDPRTMDIYEKLKDPSQEGDD